MRLDKEAAKFFGKPHKRKGRTLEGLDCYGLLAHALASAGLISSPEETHFKAIRRHFNPVGTASIVAGDVVLMQPDEGLSGRDWVHVVIASEGGKFWGSEERFGVVQTRRGSRKILAAYRLKEISQ